MKIAILGATGYIGKGLTRLLSGRGDEVIVLSRSVDHAREVFGDEVRALGLAGRNKTELAHELSGVDAIVNLAGENIGSSLWTKAKRQRILESRLEAGRLVSGIISSMVRRPGLVVQASAVGYYGSRGEESLEESSCPGEGFLADVAGQWEDSTKDVESLGARRVIIRTGVVFSSDGGALPKLAMPYNLHMGTVLGSGDQWVPWIHYQDTIGAIAFLIHNPTSSGAYNLVSPTPARMDDICSEIGRALGRKTIVHVPGLFLRIGMGKMAEETILPSQKVAPARLLEEGYSFSHAKLDEAITHIFPAGRQTHA